AQTLERMGYRNFYVDAGGDIQSRGKNAKGGAWSVGIRDPHHLDKIVKVLFPKDAGVATSGSYLQGRHIYNPHAHDDPLDGIVSLTVVGPNILDADRHATAAFAMGRDGIGFIDGLDGFEAYEIDAARKARMTRGLAKYLSG